MKKYYIGFFVLLALCAAAVIYTTQQGSTAKVDKATDKAVEDFANKVGNNYNLTSAPDSLAAAGIKDAPSTVTYTKINNTKYKICFDYKTTSGGFDAGWTSLLPASLGGGTVDQPGDVNDTALYNGNYFDSTVESNHKKGQNCQTITMTVYDYTYNPYGATPQTSTGVLTNCDTYSNTYPGRRTAKIKSIDTTNHMIYLDNSYTQNYEDSNGEESTTNISALTYNTATTFYDASCQKISDTGLVAGQRADFYVTSQSDNFAGQVEIVSADVNVITQ